MTTPMSKEQIEHRIRCIKAGLEYLNGGFETEDAAHKAEGYFTDACRSDIPFLLAEVERLQGELEEAKLHSQCCANLSDVTTKWNTTLRELRELGKRWAQTHRALEFERNQDWMPFCTECEAAREILEEK